MIVGDIVVTDSAYNDTAVAQLYGFDCNLINSTESLTDELSNLLKNSKIEYKRGKHWTNDARYMETYEQVTEYRSKWGTMHRNGGRWTFYCGELQKVSRVCNLYCFRYYCKRRLEFVFG